MGGATKLFEFEHQLLKKKQIVQSIHILIRYPFCHAQQVPPLVAETIVEETAKLQLTEGFSVDFNVVRNYLDWLTVLPWGIRTQDNLNLHRAAGILNKHHHGMIEVKRRLLEFIAVSQLRGKDAAPGRILCLHGPPGVGKTSVARSIAESLNRQYYRFSVGGMNNAAEIKGHRRTYVGAMPGKLVQCLKSIKTENPLILIDEIDKLSRGADGLSGHGSGGDPASALLELLDPEQNAAFVDFYLDVPVDLSKVLFICTANVVNDIAPTLRDRMEFIEMTGYLVEEKLAIAREYLLPKVLADCGLTEENARFDDKCLSAIVDRYCSTESGVRGLQKMLEKICRKVAYDIVVSGGEQRNHYATITAQNLTLYLGNEINSAAEQRLYRQTPPGVVMGLGYSERGGTIVYIEATRLNDDDETVGFGQLTLTGNLGNIMRESAAIALIVARNNLPANECLRKGQIHVHLPAGGSHKEGPSAGITLVAALESLALNRAVRQNMAMTGELSLGGRVMGVGGIKEKTIAARRMGVKCLILPADNQKDYEALPKNITSGLEVHFVSVYADVHRLIFSKI